MRRGLLVGSLTTLLVITGSASGVSTPTPSAPLPGQPRTKRIAPGNFDIRIHDRGELAALVEDRCARRRRTNVEREYLSRRRR